MIIRELKLRPNKKLEEVVNTWLFQLSGVYNWGIRKIEQDAMDNIYFSKMEFQNLLSNHSNKVGIPSHTLQAVLVQAWDAWDKCFKKIRKKPRFKSVRNKTTSIPFPDPIKSINFEKKTISLPSLGKLRFYKQDLPSGKIKRARIVKKASGYYVQLTIDAKHQFKVKETDSKVGIDTGFKDLAILSDGTKYENNRYYVKGQKRLAQAQRGKNKKLTARLHERNKNRRKDYNHKVSKDIVSKHSEIYITNDNIKGMSKKFGKSVGDAGISQLRNFISYKSAAHGRKMELVDSKYTTMTCSVCGALSGPTGLSELNVRHWECACGAQHDRDVNAARVILNVGLGYSLVSKGDRNVN
jgi:IS605 OrfB family transposase